MPDLLLSLLVVNVGLVECKICRFSMVKSRKKNISVWCHVEYSWNPFLELANGVYWGGVKNLPPNSGGLNTIHRSKKLSGSLNLDWSKPAKKPWVNPFWNFLPWLILDTPCKEKNMWVKQCHKPPMTGKGNQIPPIKMVMTGGKHGIVLPTLFNHDINQH